MTVLMLLICYSHHSDISDRCLIAFINADLLIYSLVIIVLNKGLRQELTGINIKVKLASIELGMAIERREHSENMVIGIIVRN